MPDPAKPLPDFSIEARLRKKGLWPIAGIDEVGRGPLAGPVCAAAVILNPRKLPEGVNDSKALNAKARESAFEKIVESALAVSFAFITAAEIDATDIRRAALQAMARAAAGLALAPAYALVDGRDLPQLACDGEAVVKGDAKSLSIAAASIIAKVARDRLMRRLGEEYPAYDFGANAGYATARHLAAIRAFGPTPHHRLSFAPLRDGA
jgi:ribonuclease HII